MARHDVTDDQDTTTDPEREWASTAARPGVCTWRSTA